MATRRDLFDPTDPANLKPEQRLAEIAAMLAKGVIRLRKQRPIAPALANQGTKIHRSATNRPIPASIVGFSSEFASTALEVSRETSPDGPRG